MLYDLFGGQGVKNSKGTECSCARVGVTIKYVFDYSSQQQILIRNGFWRLIILYSYFYYYETLMSERKNKDGFRIPAKKKNNHLEKFTFIST